MRRLALILALALSPTLVWAQGACKENQAFTSRQGFSNLAAVVPGATITASPGPLYTDQTVSVQVPGINTVTADQYGNYQLCAFPGTQTITVSGPGMATLQYQQSFGVEPNSNVTWTGTHTFSGAVTFSGTTTFTVSPTFTTFVANQVTTPLVQAPVGSTLSLNGGNGTSGGGFGVVITGGNVGTPPGGGGSIFLNGGIGNIGGNATLGTLSSNTVFSTYNGITCLSLCVSPVYAQFDTTTGAASVAGAQLYAVPASPALGGQYRVSWDAKVITAATTSTLGPLTIAYTDPDGVAQSIVMPAVISAGTIANSSTANTTTTVLAGLATLINAKASTNITYSWGYATTGGSMVYGLHIKLEAM